MRGLTDAQKLYELLPLRSPRRHTLNSIITAQKRSPLGKLAEYAQQGSLHGSPDDPHEHRSLAISILQCRMEALQIGRARDGADQLTVLSQTWIGMSPLRSSLRTSRPLPVLR